MGNTARDQGMGLIVQRRNRLFTLQGMGRSPAAIFISRQEQVEVVWPPPVTRIIWKIKPNRLAAPVEK